MTQNYNHPNKSRILLVSISLCIGLVLSSCQDSGSPNETTDHSIETAPNTKEPTAIAATAILATPTEESEPEPTATGLPTATSSPVSAEGVDKASQPSLARGVNMAGDFEVEPRGQWGTKIEAHFFDLAAEGGFDHVRIPIRWSAHTGPAPDFVIDEAFFMEIDWVLDQAERVGLTTVIDTHHFEELDADPQGNRAQLNAIWAQVGARYANRPPTVVFELNNEPTGAFNNQPDIWNEIMADALTAVRQTNPDRLVIVGPVEFNHPNRLPDLVLPDDPNLMVTIHVYDPTEFTVQGASWFNPPPATGQLWRGSWPVIAPEWQNGTWDSTVSRTADGFMVGFERQYAAFAAIYTNGTAGSFDSLTVVSDQAFEAVALCNVVEEVEIVDFGPSAIREDGWAVMQADVSSCGDLSSISVQLISETLLSPIIARSDLCMGYGDATSNCLPVIVAESEAHQRLMEWSAEWAAANGVELYLGEFGVYDHPPVPVDRPSREAWIRSMRQAAEANGINWAYFELSNEFGMYDHTNGRWNADILSALFDS